MKAISKIILFVFLMVLLSPIYAEAQLVGGKAFRQYGDRRVPAASIRVILRPESGGRSYFAYTDRSGSYYFYNVSPGQYVLQILAGQPPITQSVRVGNQRRITLPAIRVP